MDVEMNQTSMKSKAQLPVSPLEGGAFVVDSNPVPSSTEEQALNCLVGADHGARSLALYTLEVAHDDHRTWCAGESEVVLFVRKGTGLVVIGDRAFVVRPECGVYIRANECFRFQPHGEGNMDLLVGTCPPANSFVDQKCLPTFFDGSQPERVVDAAASERHSTDDRFYKLLAGPLIGCRTATQFVGMIPRSRGPEHYHEYEEAICILSGEGRFWTGEESAPVGPGSVIFLPKGQRHCLECTDDNGLTLVGLCSPASSPAVRYET